ncbi:thiolase [Propylenella binzhouense]|uniref:Thiolase n=1 Tax=Propylenella binzhouense TaxID=2555902 RepID=A0A964T6L7_9HYPH|nr:thiolase [Propylenella binzhouense]MYZ49501.1 thiolase [Propylenella binzhouense]
MSAKDLRGKVAIVGVGTAGCGEATGFSELEILAQAAKAAVEDAGLAMADIDGICTANLSAAMWPLNVVEYLGIRPKFVEGTNVGGAAFVAHQTHAMLALAAGLCDAVLVCYGSNQRTSTFGRKERTAARNLLDHNPYEAPYRPFNPPSSYAMIAARHMYQYGTTRRHLAEVAVAARKWAQLNPEAFSRGPLDVETVLNARMISDPFTVYDCCLVTDGAAAYVITRADRAKDLKQKPVHILSNATAAWHRSVANMADLTVTPSKESGERAFAAAGLGPKDMDVVQIYDAFTINTILALEDLGFCGKGEGGPFVEDGAIAPGGKLPVNTNGGGLSCVHPNMYGAFATIEAVRQLRGTCGERQVKDAKTAVVNGNGGNSASSQSTSVLATADAL